MKCFNALFLLALVCVACRGGPTMMQVCEVNSVFYYPSEGALASRACAVPQKIVWDHMPLQVSIDDEFLGEYRNSWKAAMTFWNDEIGTTLFEEGNETDVSIVVGTSDPVIAGSAYHFRGADGRLRAIVEIHTVTDVVTMKYIMAHEMGHVIGLAHDRTPVSIMYPQIEGEMMEEDGLLPMLIVSSEDQVTLRALYK